MTMAEREVRKAEWNGKLTVHADCMAVIHAVRRPGAALRDQFKYGLCYKLAGYGALGRVLKVDAHKGKDQANAEGWGDHWKGNNAADEVAKLVRPMQTGNEKRQSAAVANLRSTRRQVEGLCTRLGDMWKCMFKLKKTYIHTAAKPKPGVAPHSVLYHNGKWTCTLCGASFKKRDKLGCAMVGTKDRACPGKCRIQEQMHSSHVGHTAETVTGAKLVFCSDCGAYGTAKAVLLKSKCEPLLRCKRAAQWSAINTKQVHPTTNVPLVNYQRIVWAVWVTAAMLS